MMKLLRYPCIVLIFLLQATLSPAQTAPDTAADPNYMDAGKLAEYRRLFWDSLPAPVSWTNDFAWLFNHDQRNFLDSVINDFEKKTSAEICVVTLDTFCTAVEDFDAMALHIANRWGVGKKDKNNGLVICISPGYRRIRISNGDGISKYLSDDETNTIITSVIVPRFSSGDYFGGTLEGVQAIITSLTGRLKND